MTPGRPSATPPGLATLAARIFPASLSIVGPILLIGIGVIALLIATGHLVAVDFWTWYGHWWPALLILAGLALLAEWIRN